MSACSPQKHTFRKHNCGFFPNNPKCWFGNSPRYQSTGGHRLCCTHTMKYYLTTQSTSEPHSRQGWSSQTSCWVREVDAEEHLGVWLRLHQVQEGKTEVTKVAIEIISGAGVGWATREHSRGWKVLHLDPKVIQCVRVCVCVCVMHPAVHVRFVRQKWTRGQRTTDNLQAQAETPDTPHQVKI